MNKFINIVFFISFLVTVGYVAYLFWSVDGIVQKPDEGEVPVAMPTPEFDKQGPTMPTKSKSGQIEFVKNILLVSESQGDGVYVLQSDIVQNRDKYTIVYNLPLDQFQISLDALPLHETRLLAEEDLKNKLGVVEEILCDLNIFVRTPYTVSYSFAGRNLGLSFCPGSVSLREGVQIN